MGLCTPPESPNGRGWAIPKVGPVGGPRFFPVGANRFAGGGGARTGVDGEKTLGAWAVTFSPDGAPTQSYTSGVRVALAILNHRSFSDS